MIVTLVPGVLLCLHGFVGPRMSDPSAVIHAKLICLLDPSFYFSRISTIFEKGLELWPRNDYQSFESRRRERMKQLGRESEVPV
jgi:hypothetical protein